MVGVTLLQPCCELLPVQQVAAVDLGSFSRVAFEGVLDCDFSTILLSKECSNDRPLLLSQRMSRDVIRDGEENQRVKDRLELRALLARHEGVGALGIHGAAV